MDVLTVQSVAQHAPQVSRKDECCCLSSPPITTVAELDATFRRIRVLGEGTYGIVFEAIHIASGQKVALKKIRIGDNEDLAGIPTTAIRETALLRELKHRHIVELFDVTHIDAQLWFSFEICDLDLRQYIRQRYTELKKLHNETKGTRIGDVRKSSMTYFLPVEQCKLLTRQLLEGVAYCHSRRIIHRDLKPQNVLLNKSGTLLKIADFGLARTFTTPTQRNTHEVVTLWYRAPELLLGDNHYTPALDMWSVGCIVAEMVTGHPLFHGDCEIDTLFKIFRLMGTPVDSEKPSSSPCVWHGVSSLQYYRAAFPKWKRQPKEGLQDALSIDDPVLIDFLSQILQYPAERRLTAVEALRHPWLL